MPFWERIGLCALALGIPAVVVVVLFVRSAGEEFDRAARDCERAIRLGLPLPVDCDVPPDVPAPDAAPPGVPQAPSGDRPGLTPEDLRTYERRGGMRRSWASGHPATRVSRPAPEGRGPPPTVVSLKAPEPRPGTTYVVRAGDTFLGIVRRAYGSTDRWPDVWFENPHLVRDREILPVGTELTLPR